MTNRAARGGSGPGEAAGLCRRAVIGTAVILALAAACQGEQYAAINQLNEARRQAADLQIQFNRASDVSSRAVMADSDEMSMAFAREAESIKQVVIADIQALGPVLQRLGRAPETESWEKVRVTFAEYEVLDRAILALAVENSNLKALRLSFGPARDAAQALRDSLTNLTAAPPSPDARCQVEVLVSRVLLAVSEIRVLHAPHIAESNDLVMERIEEDMAALNKQARSALDSLTALVSASSRPRLAAALAALDRFWANSFEIVKLSRRNSNIRSVELSLRRKVSTAAACNEALRALREALEKQLSTGTR